MPSPRRVLTTGVLAVVLASQAPAPSVAPVGIRPAAATPTAATKAPRPGPPLALRALAALPLHFEANHGQTDGSVHFLARARGYTLFLTPTEAVIVTAPPRGGERTARDRRRGPGRIPDSQLPADRLSTAEAVRDARAPGRAVVRMKLVGANPDPLVSGVDQLPGRVNYFLGNDPARWRTNIPTYARVRYRDVYPGIDLVYDGKRRRMEFDFVVAPGADPGRIRLAFEGAGSVALDARGDLLLRLATGDLRLLKPQVYQEVAAKRVAVDGRFTLVAAPCQGRGCPPARVQVAVQVAAYDTGKPLVIDPVLAFSTFLGGSGDEGGQFTSLGDGVAVDASGSVYMTGETISVDFPTASPVQGACASCATVFAPDAFVAKLDSTGSTLTYATYLGGGAADVGRGIDVDASGDAYVTGLTQSLDFPTLNPLQTAPCGGSDVFVVKLDATGGLVYSTCLGGGDGRGIAVDTSGNAHVAHVTAGSCFVSKLDAAGSALVYSTGLGSISECVGVAVDTSGNAYVTGSVSPDPFFLTVDFPVLNAFDSTPNGGIDAFVTKLDASGALVYSTFLGGSGDDLGFGITVDAGGNAYVTGLTFSTDFPTASPFQGTCASCASFGTDAFVTKLDPSGSVLLYSTYLGGSGSESFSGRVGIAVDTSGNVSVAGDTESLDFPTLNALQAVHGGGSLDAFVAKLAATGGLVYSTFLGGSGSDTPTGIAVDGTGNAYVGGITCSSDFPTTPGAFQTAPGGGGQCDAFVAKITEAPAVSADLSVTLADSPDPVTVGDLLTYTATLTNLGPDDATSVTLSDVLPSAVTFFSVTASQGSCSADGTISCSLGTLAASATATVTLVVRPTTDGAISNAVSVAAAETDPTSANNTAATTTTAVQPSPPAAPTGLTATQASPSQVNLAWSHTGSDETGFEIQRDTDQSGIFAVVGTVGADVLAFQDTGVQLNRTYTYQVKALGAAGGSAFSPTATVTVRAGKLLVLPPRLTFTGVAVGTSATRTVTVQNAGQGTLSGTVGSLAGVFSVLAGSGSFTLTPGQTLTVTVEFTPAQRGTARASLTVTSDDPARSTVRVQVTGIVR
ncbi:MAG: SBBP repeat-containing protein [Candidatus Rokubacteria bacterium]|nr:SBBP repeat-containing protein [Candidatus Rokubacteria bacterium]